MSEPDSNSARAQFALLGLVSKKPRWGLTLRGLLIAFALCIILAVIFVRNAHAFLATNAPVQSDYLAVEGWIPEYAVKQCVQRVREGQFKSIVTVGGGVSGAGRNPADDDTYAYVAAERIKAISRDVPLHMVPARDEARDRTFSSAVTLKNWFHDRGIAPPYLTVATLGPHSRRTRLLYQMAFGPGTKIGVLSVQDEQYDAAHWWRYSEGVKEVISEGSAYLYARLIFRPDNATSKKATVTSTPLKRS